MNVDEAMKTRHSVRYYQDKLVPEATLKTIVQLAQESPSWANAQTEHIYIATGDSLAQLRQQYGDWNRSQHVTDAVLPMISRRQWPVNAQANMRGWMDQVKRDLGSDWDQKIMDAENVLYNAPAIVYLTLPQGYAEWSIYDLGLFSDALMVAAKSQGVDSLVAYQFIKYPELVHRNLPLNDQDEVIIGIALGYEDKTAPINRITSQRENLADVLTISK